MNDKKQEAVEIKLFSPLRGYFYDSEDDYRPFVGSGLLGYMEEIQEAICENLQDEQPSGLAKYLSDAKLKRKIISLQPAVEEYLYSLWGVLVVNSREELTEEEIHGLMREWYGQITDGWGEEFVQRKIECLEGCRLYVDFGCIGIDSIRTEQELKAPLKKTEAFHMEMG